jgi:ATP-dependent helicase/nuclease subunit A
VDVHIARAGLQAEGWFKVERRWEGSYGSTLLGEHADWAVHEATELPYLQAEEDRLLYVAATRARQMLVVSRWPVKAAGMAAWGALNGFLSSATELAVPPGVMPVGITPPDCSTAVQSAGERSRVTAHARVQQPSWSITSVTAEARHIARMTRAADAAVDDPTKVVATDTPTHRADAGVAWGTLIHGLLEHAMRHPSATREDLRRLAMWLTVEEPQLRDVIAEALDTVEQVSGDDFWTEAIASEHFVETPFTVGSGASTITTGVIDLLNATADGWNVVDYKSDLQTGSGVPEQYRQQLAAYQRALEACGLTKVSTAVRSVRR